MCAERIKRSVYSATAFYTPKAPCKSTFDRLLLNNRKVVHEIVLLPKFAMELTLSLELSSFNDFLQIYLSYCWATLAESSLSGAIIEHTKTAFR